MSEADLREQVADGRIDTVILAVPGMLGTLRGKGYDATYYLDKVAAHGTRAAAYLLATDLNMTPLPGFAIGGWDRGAGDVHLRPDPGTLRPAGWQERTALVLADAHDHTGAPIPLAPRAILTRQIHRLEALGLRASLGIEAEAAVFDISYRDAHRRGYRALPAAADHNTDYALTHRPALTALSRAIRDAALRSALPLEAIKSEADHGQLEVTFQHAEPLAAAANHAVFKLLAKSVAEQQGMALSFMAKPFTTRDGNSGHLHLSLRGPDGGSVFDDGAGALTHTGRHAIAGCLAVLDRFLPLMAPMVNSYKRLGVPRAFVPTNLSWGYDNRTCALRLVGRGAHARVECRIPGADAEPHLAAAALLAAMIHGIEQRLPLTAGPVAGDAGAQDRTARLPASLHDALARFTASPVAAQAFGGDVVEHYAQGARHELERHARGVTDLERERGFALA